MYLTYDQANSKDLIRHLAGQVISTPIVSIERLPGTMACNYDVNHKYVFKLPNEYTSTDDWLHQSQCAPILQQHLTFQIPQPQLRTIHTPDGQALLSSFYPKIEGICLMDDAFVVKDKAFKKRFFEQLSDAANQIHTISPKDLPFELPTKIDYLEKCFFKNISGDTYLPKTLFRKLLHNSFLGLGKSGIRTSLLAHTDLHSGNVLLDDKGKLIGIIDFDMMVRGDRFLEFRPNLYEDPTDMLLFRKTFQEHTGNKIDSDDVYQLQVTQNTLRWFFALYNLCRFLPLPERNKKMKQSFKQKVASAKGSEKCI